MAQDWSVYGNQPNFSTKQAGKVRRMKKFLANDHSASSEKRIKGKLTQLYKSRGKARTAYNETPLYGEGTATGGQMDSQVISATRGKYGQAMDDTSKQIQSAPYRQAQISKYYDDYQAELGNLRSQQAAQTQQMIDAQGANTAATQKTEQAGNTAAAQTLSADAASRGQSVDTSQFAKANQASAARATTGNTQQAALMSAKSAYDNFYGQQSLISKGSKQSALGLEQKSTNTLRDKLLGLQKDAGDFATTTRAGLDEAQFQRGISSQALGLKKSAQDLAAQKESRIAAGGTGGTSSGGGTGGTGGTAKGETGGLTPTQVRGYKSKYRTLKAQTAAALTTINSETGKPILTGGGKAAQQYINALIAGGTDPLIAEAAVLSALRKAGKSTRADKALAKKIHEEFGFWPDVS